jgi:hypothetical protein
MMRANSEWRLGMWTCRTTGYCQQCVNYRRRLFRALPIFFVLSFILDYTKGVELVDSVLGVIRKEGEGTDCLPGKLVGLIDRAQC